MMTYGELSGIYKMILQAILVIILVMQINVVMSLTFNVKKYNIAFLQIMGILMNVVLLSVLMGEHQAVFRELKSTFMVNSASGMPVWVLVVLLIIIIGIFVGSIVYLERLQKKIITENSIKESTDDLPMGLCFAKKDGKICLKMVLEDYRALLPEDYQREEIVRRNGILSVKEIDGAEYVLLRMSKGGENI